MTAAVAHRLTRDVIRVTGSETPGYLQGQLSQDIEAIAVGASAWSLLLQPSGRIDSWFRIHRVAEHEMLIDVDAGHGPAAVDRLERFKLRTDVEFSTETGWSMVSVRGSDAASVRLEAELSASVAWPGFDGVDHLGPDLELSTDVDQLAVEQFEALRIAAAWPRMGSEITPDTIPAEVGESLIATSVSFTKGCYTGQELVARIDSRGGSGPKPLRVLVAPSDSRLAVGSPIEWQGTTVGEVTSTATDVDRRRVLALAVLQRKVEPGSTVRAGGAVATVVDAPA